MESREYQQLMYDLLGNRDYDNFENNELDCLKKKIGFALYGQPIDENGYDAKQNNSIELLYHIFLSQSNKFSKHKNRVVVSFIYNCTEPLDSVKKKRASNSSDYNPKKDMQPYPVFILRKCKYSPTSCRIIIDHSGRVYKSWTQYLRRNTLPKCLMVFPKNGRYTSDSSGQVIIESQLSPACGVYAKILSGTDIASSGIGLASAGVTIAASLPAVTVIGPLALCGAGVAGIGVSIYSVGRSLATLYDKKKHKECLSFSDSVARSTYINIVAGAAGFIGAGTNIAVSQLTSRGVYIGKHCSRLLTTINATKLGTSGLAILNSGYEVLEPWVTDKRSSSLLTLVQLSSSILFFGHAVYNFKSTSTLIEETQSKMLQDIQESLGNRRSRNAFQKLRMKALERNNGQVQKGNAEMISTLRKINDINQITEILSKVDPDLEKLGVKYTPKTGTITFNGVPVDLGKVNGFLKRELENFLSLSTSSDNVTPSNIVDIKDNLRNTFNVLQLESECISKLSNYFVGIMTGSLTNMANPILFIMKELVYDYLVKDENILKIMNELFPHSEEKCLHIINSVTGFLYNKAKKIDAIFKVSNETAEMSILKPVFDYLKEQNFNENNRLKYLMKFICDNYVDDGKLSLEIMHEFGSYFANFITEQALLFKEKKEKEKKREEFKRTVERKKCPHCFGLYYSVINET